MPLIGSIDQGTTSSRFIIFDEKFHVLASHQLEHKQICQKPGWVEHDPLEILDKVKTCMSVAYASLSTAERLSAIGVTNQRETTVVWDKFTGQPLYNAIVWNDARTSSTVAEIMAQNGNDRQIFRPQCGLPISTYFSALKMRWLLDNVPSVKAACDEGRALFGTIDTWLVWNLTGRAAHVTDVTNASRTMLMDLKTLEWSADLCKSFGIPSVCLPKICSSAEVYGRLDKNAAGSDLFEGVPISGILGDQQSATVGQLCFRSGDAKSTYGTGCFMLLNTGSEPVASKNGLLTTALYKMGPSATPTYALEGSVAVAGSAVSWLRDNLGIIQSAAQVEELASKVPDTGGVYFVPAFGGLFAPYWRDDARGIIAGITQFTNRCHIVRSVLEAVCFQSKEVLDAMKQDSGVELTKLKVDGGMTANNLLMQLQADLLGKSVARPKMAETTALGAAIAASIGAGMYKNVEEIEVVYQPNLSLDEFTPTTSDDERSSRLKSWQKAVERTFDWVQKVD